MWTLFLILASCAALPFSNAAWMFPFHSGLFPSIRPALGYPFGYDPWMPRMDGPVFPSWKWLFPDTNNLLDSINMPSKFMSQGSTCRKVNDVDGLTFPPHSEVPTDKLDPEMIIKNDVKHTTYLCRDMKNNYFYKLVTEATFATPDIKNEQTTVKYYKTDKEKINSGDMLVDKQNIWPQKKPDHPFSSLFEQYWPASPKVEDEIKCVPTDNDESLPYPNIPDPSSAELNNEKIVSRNVHHNTELCSSKDSSYQYYMLHTKLTVKTDRGTSASRMASKSHPKSGSNPNVYSQSYSTSGSYSTGI